MSTTKDRKSKDLTPSTQELRPLLVVCLGTFFHMQSVGSISVLLPAIQKEFGTSLAAVQWIGLMGASLLMAIPVVIIYPFAQKYMVEGLTAGSVKG